MFDAQKVKQDFPALVRPIKGKPHHYLDSTATSQKPQAVIDAVSDFYSECNANVHRGIYDLSEAATERFEEARQKVAGFFNAKTKETIFTRNATESLNLVARAWGDENVKAGDRILVSEMEHHSNIVPWQMLARRKQAQLEFVKVTAEGELDANDLEEKLSQSPKIVSLTNCSNVLGTFNDVEQIGRKVHRHGGILVVDAAQGAAHLKLDVKKMDCDFMAVSGHKMLAPSGIGVLYGKKELLLEMPPFLGGGDMIREVSEQEASWNDLPYKFEAGTPAAADAVGLGAAVDYLESLGMDNVREHERQLTRKALEAMHLPDVTVYGPKDADRKGGLVAFNLKGIHPHDVASIFNEQGIAVRAGHHCAQILMKRLGVAATARASFYVYTDERDIDALVEGVQHAKKLMG